MISLAEQPGVHQTVDVCGGASFQIPLLNQPFYPCQLNTDSLLSTAVAVVVTVAIALWVAARVSQRTPGKFQMVFEFLWDFVRNLVRDSVGDDARFVIPLAVTIGFYIFVADWLGFFPLFGPVHPAAADLNQTGAMALLVIVLVQAYSIRILGFGGYLRRFTRPFELPLPVRIIFVPLNIIEEIVKPVTLALRLFGNIFAGAVMIYLLGLLFTYGISQLSVSSVWGPVAIIFLFIWKAFDVFFVGTIQAFIFMLLTVIYFGMAREGLEEEHHGQGHVAAQRRAA